VEQEDLALQVADAPSVAVNRVATYKGIHYNMPRRFTLPHFLTKTTWNFLRGNLITVGNDSCVRYQLNFACELLVLTTDVQSAEFNISIVRKFSNFCNIIPKFS
jgi:hypothetical protein